MPTKKDTTEKQIEKMSDSRERTIKKLKPDEQKNVEGLVDAIEAIGLEEFIEYIRSPWKMLWPNFVAGVARGFGALVGATIVIALIGWTLSRIIDLPLIGQRLEPYVKNVQTEIKKYTEATNYKDNFVEMQKLLTEMRDELKVQKQQIQNLPR